ncbi:MAG TPA: hypothetical protein VFJ16_32315 [Longimicrobium sp.]|nr:hypothetical protein [Longimicrobium sp.]
MELTTIDRARAYGLDIGLLRSCMLRSAEERLSMACGNASDIARVRRRPGDFVALLDRLVASEARFVLVGSMAAAAHGSAYIPNDMDICYDTAVENVRSLTSALMPINPRPADGSDWDFSFNDESVAANHPLLPLRTVEGDLDLFACVDGVGGYGECLAASERIPWKNSHVRALVPEALIVSLENRLELAMLGPLLALQAIIRLMIEGPALRGYTMHVL